MIKLICDDFKNVQASDIGDIDLIIADPPDNIGLKYPDYDDNKKDFEYKIDLENWLYHMKQLTRGPIFFTFNQRWTKEVENAIDTVGLSIIQRLQWYFTFGQSQDAINKYSLCHRPIYWLNSTTIFPENIRVPSARQIKYRDKRANKNGKLPSDVWEFSRVCGTFKERRRWSPTQLPEALVERIVKGHCPSKGRVLDPFMGSGTTAIVCQRLGFDCVGIDISRTCISEIQKELNRNREQWVSNLRNWTASHDQLSYDANGGRDSIYDGRGE